MEVPAPLNNSYTMAWISWLVNFLVTEGMALINKEKGDTLSEHVWRWASIKGKSKGWLARRASLGAFLAWLVTHMMTGGKV